MLKRWLKTIGAVLALLLVSGLMLVLIVVGANLIRSFLVSSLNSADWMYQHTVQANFTASTIMNFYYIICGIFFLGFFCLMEYRLVTTGVPKKLVLRRTFFTLGVEIFVLTLMQLAVMAYSTVLPVQVGLIVIGIFLSVGFIYLGRRKASISPV